MRSLVARVDAWCRRGDLTLHDLAWFRIIFSGGILLTLQPTGALSRRPPERFDPPPGPFVLFESLPSLFVLEGIELVTALLAALLLVGLHTRAVSILLSLSLMTGFGLTYSYGHISHTILLALTPFLMAFSSWGEIMSVDASRAGRTPARDDVAQWPMRFLAVTIALAFATAGWAKILSGWLDPHTHAVQGHFVRGVLRDRRNDWLAPDVIDLHFGHLWEAADWFAVLLEAGLLVAVLWWRSFRVGIAVAALFHVGILLLMNIAFSWNLLAYAAFVRWEAIVRWNPRVQLRRSWGYGVGLSIGVTAFLFHAWVGQELQKDVRTALILLGGAAGAIYLGLLGARLGRMLRRRPTRVHV